MRAALPRRSPRPAAAVSRWVVLIALLLGASRPAQADDAPLLHLGQDPTAAMARAGGVWVSGLRLVWGATAWLQLESDLGALAGLGGRLDPNLGLRVRLMRARLDGITLELAAGVDGHLTTLNAQRQTTTRVTYADEGGEPTFEVRSQEVVEVAAVRPWAARTSVPAWDPTATVRELLTFEPLFGWRATAWLASRVSLATQGGGRLSWHVGGQVSAHPVGWAALPSWRVWTGVDFDLGRARLFGSAAWDPDRLNALTRQPGLQVDLGLVWAWTPRFRTVIHVQPSFVGLLWQLRAGG